MLPRGVLKDRQIPARFVEELLFIPKVRLTVAPKKVVWPDDDRGVVQGVALSFEQATDDKDAGLLR